MRGQYCDVIGAMPAMLTVGLPRCPPPGTCTGMETPGEISPVTRTVIVKYYVYYSLLWVGLFVPVFYIM